MILRLVSIVSLKYIKNCLDCFWRPGNCRSGNCTIQTKQVSRCRVRDILCCCCYIKCAYVYLNALSFRCWWSSAVATQCSASTANSGGTGWPRAISCSFPITPLPECPLRPQGCGQCRPEEPAACVCFRGQPWWPARGWRAEHRSGQRPWLLLPSTPPAPRLSGTPANSAQPSLPGKSPPPLRVPRRPSCALTMPCPLGLFMLISMSRCSFFCVCFRPWCSAMTKLRTRNPSLQKPQQKTTSGNTSTSEPRYTAKRASKLFACRNQPTLWWVQKAITLFCWSPCSHMMLLCHISFSSLPRGSHLVHALKPFIVTMSDSVRNTLQSGSLGVLVPWVGVESWLKLNIPVYMLAIWSAFN